MENEFKLVIYNSKSRRKLAKHRDISLIKNQINNLALIDLPTKKLIEKIESAQNKLKKHSYFSSFTQILRASLNEHPLHLSQIICYALGSFGNYTSSRFQLAFLLLLKEELKINEVQIYDPTFTSNEKAVLSEEYNLTVLNENEEGKKIVEKGTIFYLPHAPHQLVNNLIYSNWTTSSLPLLLLFSNSFTNLGLREKETKKELDYVDKARKICIEYEVENTFYYDDVFNDMGIHRFVSKIVDNEFWERGEEPQYEKLDYIKSNHHHGIDEIDSSIL